MPREPRDRELMVPVCQGCKKEAGDLPEYDDLIEHPSPNPAVLRVQREHAVRTEEGTYNNANGHFLCTPCYIAAGTPSAPYPGWVCP